MLNFDLSVCLLVMQLVNICRLTCVAGYQSSVIAMHAGAVPSQCGEDMRIIVIIMSVNTPSPTCSVHKEY